MADEKTDDEQAEDIYNAVRFSSVWCHQFFTRQYGGSRKFSRAGFSLRFNFQSLYWAGGFALMTALILAAIKKAMGGTEIFFLTSTPAIAILCVASAVAGWLAAGWSPMAKSTGEGFNDWVKLKITRFFTDCRYRGAKPPTTLVYSKAKPQNGQPRLIKAKEYLGTVPALKVAPTDPKNEYIPGDMSSRATVHTTDFHLYPRGHYVLHEEDNLALDSE